MGHSHIETIEIYAMCSDRTFNSWKSREQSHVISVKYMT